jgi:hypothetical protein
MKFISFNIVVISIILPLIINSTFAAPSISVSLEENILFVSNSYLFQICGADTVGANESTQALAGKIDVSTGPSNLISRNKINELSITHAAICEYRL